MTTELSAVEKALLKVLKKHPTGIRKADLIAASGWTSYHCAKALRNLRALGLAGPTLRGSKSSAWATAENVTLIRAELARVAEARRLSALARAADAQFKERQQSEDDCEVSAFARPSVHRLVPVGEWERPQIPGPSSVFNLTKEAA